MHRVLPVLWILLSSCSFDSVALDARRCSAEIDCDHLGVEYSCVEGYCVAGAPCDVDGDCAGVVSDCVREECVLGSCARIFVPVGTVCAAEFTCVVAACDAQGVCAQEFSDSRCQDELFCNGAELCVPQLSGDDSGCVAGATRDVTDNVACTVGYCEEGRDVVLQDTSACQCDVPGALCAYDASVPPCFAAVCTDQLTCVLEPLPAGSDCNDGLMCTRGEQCTADQRCLGTQDDGVCDDGLFCNGTESCDPDSPASDTDGCKPGIAPTLSDDVECTIDSCDNDLGRVVHDRSECGCTEHAVCQGDCVVGHCTNAGICQFEFKDAGEICNDGANCSQGDACDGAGHCVGSVDLGNCDDGVYCNGEETCDPASPVNNAEGCVRGMAPTDGVPARDCEVVECDEDVRRVFVDDSGCCDPMDETPLSGACFDEIDNDCDGFIDGADSDCDFVPTVLGGLTLWLDAADLDSIVTDDAGLVSDWYDRSGRGNHGQANREERPRLVAWDGSNRISFEGAQHMIVGNESQFDFGEEMTAIVVFSVAEFAVDWQALLAKGDDAWRVHRFRGSPGVAYGWTYFWGSEDIGGQAIEVGDDLHQAMAVWRPRAVEFILDGRARVERGFLLEYSLDQNDKPLWVGNNSDHPGRGWRGHIAEVLVYDRALTSVERAEINRYLRDKWNLP